MHQSRDTEANDEEGSAENELMMARDKETKEIEASKRRGGERGEEEEMVQGDRGNEREAAAVDRNTHRKEPAMMQSKIRRRDMIQARNSSPGDSVAGVSACASPCLASLARSLALVAS